LRGKIGQQSKKRQKGGKEAKSHEDADLVGFLDGANLFLLGEAEDQVKPESPSSSSGLAPRTKAAI
jgi:hypothetical protein